MAHSDSDSSPAPAGAPAAVTPVAVPDSGAGEPSAASGIAAAGAAIASAARATGSSVDDLWGRLLGNPRRAALLNWLLPLLVVLLAAVLRLWNLGHPQALVFDETFYVKDAFTLWNNGYESRWPEDANTNFNAGDVYVFLKEASYVVHPPLGKWMIGLGMAIFGPENAFGWRISTALVGIAGVYLIMLVARRLLGSPFLALVAGFLFAIDGHAIVMSRVAILDNSVMLFGLLGAYFVLRDRHGQESRLAEYVAAARRGGVSPGWGPAVWNRPWIVAAGLAFGAASAVKWSGLYFLAFFGLYLIAVDAFARWRAGVPHPALGAVAKQGPVTFALYVPVAVVVYLLSWTGWFATSGGYGRQWAETAGNAWEGALAWVPHSVQSFIHYHQQMYAFHVGLSSPHPYQANPLGWLAMIRPTSMWYQSPSPAMEACGAETCSQAITSIANPLIWWAAAAATLYLVYRLARFHEWRVGFILMGLLAGYVPWLMYTERTVFQFYTIAFEPYMILALVYVIGRVIGSPTDDRARRTRAVTGLAAFLAAATVLSAFWFPLWTGTTVSHWFWNLHSWIPGWV